MKARKTQQSGLLHPLVRRIVAGRAYTVMDSLMTSYERGECEFRGEDGGLLVPKIFGRAGDGFHAVFNSPNDGTQRPGDAEATNATRATPPGSLE